MKRTFLISFGILLLASAVAAVWLSATAIPPRDRWSKDEKDTLRQLWIGSLPPLPPDPSNAYADDPSAVALGYMLFFDTRLSLDGQVSCALCHKAKQLFVDGLPQAGVRSEKTDRKTMTIIGTAYSPWQFWDGRKDSQWAQALGPLESAVEHDGTRTQYAHLIDQYYRTQYEAIFGAMPDISDRSRFPDVAGPLGDEAARAAWDGMASADREVVTRIYVNIGKAIAAYERLIMPGPSRFDQYAQAVLERDRQAMQTSLNDDEVAGLRLFMGQARCIKCHNGPLFTDNNFHNTGVPTAKDMPIDDGRASGVLKLLADEFNCLSIYSDAGAEDCAGLRSVVSTGEQLLGAFKPPTLRNVAKSGPPYMHVGQFHSLGQVITHYNNALPGPIGLTELEPLHLDQIQQAQLEAFLRALSGPLNVLEKWLETPEY